jgi:hypothetical protein
MNYISTLFLNHCLPFTAEIKQCSRFGADAGSRPEWDLCPLVAIFPSVSTSKILRSARESALRILAGIELLDEDGSSPLQIRLAVARRDDYQAVRDTTGYVRLGWLVVSTTQFPAAFPLRRMIQPPSLEKMSRSEECSGVPR